MLLRHRDLVRGVLHPPLTPQLYFVRRKAMKNKREKTIRVRVNEEEFANLSQKADEVGLSMSAFLREMTNLKPINNRQELKILNTNLRRIGVNVNQIARYVNSQKGYSSVDVAELATALISIERQLEGLRNDS